MKYAIVEKERREAVPQLRGECPVCQAGVVAKCGEQRVWHWAHTATRNCDRWWDAETEWHRAWKNLFPNEWQEDVQRAADGEKHVADVKTAHGWVIEFQHSHLRPDERRAREAFYGRMVWVVDGQRLKRGGLQFFRALNGGRRISVAPLIFAVWLDECGMLRAWIDSCVPVFFDFGDMNDEGMTSRLNVPMLWLLHEKSTVNEACLVPIKKAEFIRAFLAGEPCRGINFRPAVHAASPPLGPPAFVSKWSRPMSFKQYMARRHRDRSRIRF